MEFADILQIQKWEKNWYLLALLNSSEGHEFNRVNRYQFFFFVQSNVLNKNDNLAISVGRVGENNVIFDRKRCI